MRDLVKGMLSRRRRVRTLLQSETRECGLACLAMVANTFRHDIDLGYLRALFPVAQSGMSLGDIVELADGLDLDASGYEIANVGELRNLALPAILHWNGDHFVVLERIAGGRYHVHDPEFGLRVYDRADMERMFSGVALDFSPRMEFQRLKAERRLTFVEVFKGTRGLGSTAWQVGLVSLVVTLLGLATPVLLEVAIDVVIPQVDVDLLKLLALGLLLLMAFEAAGRWLRNYVILRASTLLQLQFTRNVVGHAFRLPLSYFELRHPGDFVVRVDSIDHIKTFLVGGLVTALADSATSILLVALMFYYATDMAAVTLATLFVVLLMRVVTVPALKRHTTAALEARSQEQATLIDGLRRIDTLKAHNGTELFSLRWFDSFSRFADMDFRAKKVSVDAELMLQFVIAASTVATLYMGVTGVIANRLSIGVLYAFFSLRGTFFERANLLTMNLLHLSVMRAHFQRLDDVIGQDPEPDLHELRFHRTIRRDVRLENVGIRFGQAAAPLLSGVDLSIDVAGAESIAIVGTSGSGKSSLLKVMASLGEPSTGRIVVDGAPLGQFGKREFRSNLGVVFADDGLVAGTVADNISLFDPAVSRADMEVALGRVGLLGEVEALPQGFATPVSDENSLLSTGQRRRLVLARALVRKPRLLLLDEITANLDPATEAALIRSLKDVPAAKVFVTHSDRLLDQVDRVLKIEDGRLVEVDPRRARKPERELLPG